MCIYHKRDHQPFNQISTSVPYEAILDFFKIVPGAFYADFKKDDFVKMLNNIFKLPLTLLTEI